MEPAYFKENVVSTKELNNKKSIVWSYIGFLKKDGKIIDDSNYYCSICFQKEIIQTFKKTTSTSNMHVHLDKEHKGVDATARKVDGSQRTITQFTERSISSTFNSNDQAVVKVARRQLKVTKAGIKLCCNQLVNLDIISDEGLKSFLSEFTSVRQNNDISETCVLEELDHLFEGMQNRIKEELSDINTICLSMLDYVFWKHEHIMVLKVNYLDENWELRRATLSIEARNLHLDYVQPSGWVKSNISHYNISGKTLRFVSKDTLTSRKSVESLPCISYIIASALHELMLDTVITVYEKIRSVYNTIYFMKNSVITDIMIKVSKIVQLMQRCEQVCLFPNTNLKDGLPPWYIQRHILRAFLDEKDLLVDILETSEKCDLLPEDAIIGTITDILLIYDCFMRIIKHIYCHSEPFISSKILVKQYLMEQLKEIATEIHDATVSEILENIIDKMDKLIVISDLDLLASLLDVRSKDLSSTKEHMEKFKVAPIDIIKKYLDIEKITIDDNENSGPSKPISRNKNRKSLFTKSKTTGAQGNLVDSNIDLFLNEIMTDLTVNDEKDNGSQTKPQNEMEIEEDEDEGDPIFDWWKKNENKYKSISILAKKYLPILITSVPEEFYDVEFVNQLFKMACINNYVREKVAFIHYNNVLDSRKEQ